MLRVCYSNVLKFYEKRNKQVEGGSLDKNLNISNPHPYPVGNSNEFSCFEIQDTGTHLCKSKLKSLQVPI